MKIILGWLLLVLLFIRCGDAQQLEDNYQHTIENLQHFQVFQARQLDYCLQDPTKVGYRDSETVLTAILCELENANQFFQQNWKSNPKSSLALLNKTQRECQEEYKKLLCNRGKYFGFKPNEVEMRLDDWALENKVFPLHTTPYPITLNSLRIQSEWAIYQQRITQVISELSGGRSNRCFFGIPIYNLPTQNVLRINEPTTLKFGLGFYPSNAEIADISIQTDGIPIIPSFDDFYNDTIHLSTTVDTTFKLDINYNRIHPFTLEVHPFYAQHFYDVTFCSK